MVHVCQPEMPATEKIGLSSYGPKVVSLCQARGRATAHRLTELRLHLHLTQCINQMVLESQPPHQSVNLLFTITNSNDKLTIWLGSWLSKPIQLIHCVRSSCKSVRERQRRWQRVSPAHPVSEAAPPTHHCLHFSLKVNLSFIKSQQRPPSLAEQLQCSGGLGALLDVSDT